MELTLDIKNIKPFLHPGQLDGWCKEAVDALDTLLSGRGKGGNMTGWLRLADEGNADVLANIKEAAGQIGSDSDALVVVGIGGSYLGTRAALEFVKSPSYNQLPKNTPDIYFAASGLSSSGTADIISMLGDRDFSINVISKSGTTIESAVTFRIFRELLEKKYGENEAAKRIYVTTDKTGGALKFMADQEGYKTFVIPDDVGGRFSVFTPVGLLPLAVAGVDIDATLAGARFLFDAGKNHNPRENPALLYAAVRNGIYRQGRKIELFAGFEPALRFTGEWWKQLYGESEGKNRKGLFPASVDFTADLHSMGQYIQQGPRLLLETFVKVEYGNADLKIPFDVRNADGLNFLADRKLTWANHQALAATAVAHMDGGVPNMTVAIPRADAESFGELAAFFEQACGISGYMLDVNPFDQPGVEAYKINMFALLGKPGYKTEREKLNSRISGGPVEKVSEYHLGIDLGGTNIAAGIVVADGRLVGKVSIPTEVAAGRRQVCENIRRAAELVLAEVQITIRQLDSLGVGYPGEVDRENKSLGNAVNIPCLRGIKIKDIFAEMPESCLFVDNDANAAALGELASGSGTGVKDLVMLTLGTGVGGGIIMNGKLYTGCNGAAGEIGHMVIYENGRACTCGRRGCFEQYASATGLIRTTIEEMNRQPDSVMWEPCGKDTGKVDGRTAFCASERGDPAAKRAVERYLNDLACGIINLTNLFQPEIVVISGGISKEGNKILLPLRQIYEKEQYKVSGRSPKLRIATCADAGIIGAAMLYTQSKNDV